MAKKSEENDKEALESRLKRLVGILERLGEGEVSLQGADKLFQEGMRLVKDCRKELRETRSRVEKINRNTGRLEPLTPEE